MDNHKKLAFIHSMTAQGLDHMAKTVNVPTPDGKMSHDKKMSFIQTMAKHGLQHFDAGGSVLGGPTNTTVNANTSGASGLGGMGNMALPPGVQNEASKIPVVGSSVAPMLNPLGVLQDSTKNNFQAAGANLQQGTNADQLNSAYNQAQSGIGQQQALANQAGVGGTQGMNTQQALAYQLSQQAAGKGPNPAQAALNQSTGQNIRQQAALMAGQRGAGSNAGLMATQAAQQGANTQQQAVGQSATLQAQQQLAAQKAQQDLAATQVNQAGQAISGYNTAAQNEQNILQGANTAYNNANVSMTSNQNNVNSQVSEGNQAASNNLMGGAFNALGGSLSSMFAEGGAVQSNLGGGNYTAVAGNGGASIGSSTPVQQGNPFASSGGDKKDDGGDDEESGDELEAGATEESGGSADLAGSLGGAMLAAHGGMIPHYDEGGDVQTNLGSDNYTAVGDDSGSSSVGSSAPVQQGNPFAQQKSGGGGGGMASMLPMLAMLAAKGGRVPENMPKHLHGMASIYHPMSGGVGTKLKSGGQVPGTPQVKHDDYKNDTVPAMLSPGEIVIDLDTLKRKDDLGKKARFVAQHLAKKGLRKKA